MKPACYVGDRKNNSLKSREGRWVRLGRDRQQRREAEEGETWAAGGEEEAGEAS